MKKFFLAIVLISIPLIAEPNLFCNDGKLLELKAKSEAIDMQRRNIYLSFLPGIEASISDSDVTMYDSPDRLSKSFDYGANVVLNTNGKRYYEYRIVVLEKEMLLLQLEQRKNELRVQFINELCELLETEKKISLLKSEKEYVSKLKNEKYHLFEEGNLKEDDYLDTLFKLKELNASISEQQFLNISLSKRFKEKYKIHYSSVKLKNCNGNFNNDYKTNYDLRIKEIQLKVNEYKYSSVKKSWLPQVKFYYKQQYSGYEYPYTSKNQSIGFSLSSSIGNNSISTNNSKSDNETSNVESSDNSLSVSLKPSLSYLNSISGTKTAIKILKNEIHILKKNIQYQLKQLQENKKYKFEQYRNSLDSVKNNEYKFQKAELRYLEGKITEAVLLKYKFNLEKEIYNNSCIRNEIIKNSIGIVSLKGEKIILEEYCEFKK